jgi:hypothetical protein
MYGWDNKKGVVPSSSMGLAFVEYERPIFGRASVRSCDELIRVRRRVVRTKRSPLAVPGLFFEPAPIDERQECERQDDQENYDIKQRVVSFQSRVPRVGLARLRQHLTYPYLRRIDHGSRARRV